MEGAGKVVVASRGGEGWGLHFDLWPRVPAFVQSARRTGVGQDTRGSMGRLVKDAGRERDGEKERDRWIEV